MDTSQIYTQILKRMFVKVKVEVRLIKLLKLRWKSLSTNGMNDHAPLSSLLADDDEYPFVEKDIAVSDLNKKT